MCHSQISWVGNMVSHTAVLRGETEGADLMNRSMHSWISGLSPKWLGPKSKLFLVPSLCLASWCLLPSYNAARRPSPDVPCGSGFTNLSNCEKEAVVLYKVPDLSYSTTMQRWIQSSSNQLKAWREWSDWLHESEGIPLLVWKGTFVFSWKTELKPWFFWDFSLAGFQTETILLVYAS